MKIVILFTMLALLTPLILEASQDGTYCPNCDTQNPSGLVGNMGNFSQFVNSMTTEKLEAEFKKLHQDFFTTGNEALKTLNAESKSMRKKMQKVQKKATGLKGKIEPAHVINAFQDYNALKRVIDTIQKGIKAIGTDPSKNTNAKELYQQALEQLAQMRIIIGKLILKYEQSGDTDKQNEFATQKLATEMNERILNHNWLRIINKTNNYAMKLKNPTYVNTLKGTIKPGNKVILHQEANKTKTRQLLREKNTYVLYKYGLEMYKSNKKEGKKYLQAAARKGNAGALLFLAEEEYKASPTNKKTYIEKPFKDLVVVLYGCDKETRTTVINKITEIIREYKKPEKKPPQNFESFLALSLLKPSTTSYFLGDS